MKLLKEFFTFFINPIHVIANRDFCDIVTKFFHRHVWMIYVLSFFISFLVFYLVGGFDSLISLLFS